MKAWKRTSLIAISVAVIGLGTAGARPDDDHDSPNIPADAAGGTLQRGETMDKLPKHARNQSGGGNMTDHGGRILPGSNIYYIWWGSVSVWPGDAYAGLTSLAGGFNGSAFMSDIFPQYMRGTGVSTNFVKSLYDSSAPPAHGPSTSTIVNEACKAINANGLTADPTAVYVVLTSNFPKGANYCAWHSWGSCNGQTIQVAYMPNTTGVAGCNDPMLSCNKYSQGTQSIANVLSHEFSEAITDATGSAWYDNSGSEIGDKCAWQFSACVKLTTGSWQLQNEWSNAANGCVQQ
jgi:hypothetical protein